MKVVVIGGGPAGLMAAGTAKNNGADVVLFEKNEKVGKKLYITGKGRCNLTNSCKNGSFFDNIVHNSKFLYSSYNNFDYYALIEFCKKYNLSVKEERGGRVFPTSDKASDVTKTLVAYCKGVNIILNTRVNKLLIDDGKVVGVGTNYGAFYADKVIIACGGISYPVTGSTGDGYTLAKSVGHTIIEPKPALVPLITSKVEQIKEVEGLSLKNVAVTAVFNDKSTITEFGEMLFTSSGISGPLVLTLSSRINEKKTDYLSIDFKPALNEEVLDKRLLREFNENSNKSLKNILGNLLPKSLIESVVNRAGLSLDVKANAITGEERKNLLKILKDYRLYDFNLADVSAGIVTAGGVSVKEINPKTMESKTVKNLYFAGEVIDVDGLTGGYNIHIALCTGVAAGKYASEGE